MLDGKQTLDKQTTSLPSAPIALCAGMNFTR